MKAIALILLIAAASQCSAFHETFSEGWDSRWSHSAEEKYAGKFEAESPSKTSSDPALKVTEKAKHYGIATVLPSPADPTNSPLVLQYDIQLSNGLSCGGAYLKFLTADATFKASALKDDSPYTVMFGPDVCGMTNKVHLILRHKNPKTGTIEEKHLQSPPSVFTDELPHVYTAILYPNNNTYAVLIDGEEKKAGSLFEDFDPAFVPATEIDDPEDKKPEDWVDDEKIVDPDATKPEDWDEDAPEFVPDEDAEKPEGWLDDEPAEVDDADAKKPEDWDDEEDGDWEAPKVANPKCKEAPGCGAWVRPTKPNPEYKGKWSAPLIDNPKYKGPWAPRKIDNPEFFNDTAPLKNIGKVGAVAIEIWTMDEGYFFDNVVVTDSVEEAAAIRESTWAPKFAAGKAEADKKEKEEEAKAKAEEAKENTFAAKVGKSVTDAVDFVFDLPFLAPLADTLAPVRAILAGNPMAVVAVISAVVALVLTPAVMGGAKKNAQAVADGKAKKVDAPTPAAATANGKDEIEEEEEEEDENASPSKGGTRRRRA